MSLKIIKTGILDSIQDLGRTGKQHLGINVNGAMDLHSPQLANALLGKPLSSPVIEMHFPASEFLFLRSTVIVITGADFNPLLDETIVPLNRAVMVRAGSVLRFHRIRSGTRAYLATYHDFQLTPWMNSYSTNLKAEAGGYQGRRLKKDDEILFTNDSRPLNIHESVVLNWQAVKLPQRDIQAFSFLRGNEWCWLTKQAQKAMLEGSFLITNQADRMGYRLMGPKMLQEGDHHLVSSGVKSGTIQLLPNGQLIVLMADSHTTGGYPRIGHVISADLPGLAQVTPRKFISWKLTDLQTAEKKYIEQQNYYEELRKTSYLKLQNHLHAFM